MENYENIIDLDWEVEVVGLSGSGAPYLDPGGCCSESPPQNPGCGGGGCVHNMCRA